MHDVHLMLLNILLHKTFCLSNTIWCKVSVPLFVRITDYTDYADLRTYYECAALALRTAHGVCLLLLRTGSDIEFFMHTPYLT